MWRERKRKWYIAVQDSNQPQYLKWCQSKRRMAFPMRARHEGQLGLALARSWVRQAEQSWWPHNRAIRVRSISLYSWQQTVHSHVMTAAAVGTPSAAAASCAARKFASAWATCCWRSSSCRLICSCCICSRCRRILPSSSRRLCKHTKGWVQPRKLGEGRRRQRRGSYQGGAQLGPRLTCSCRLLQGEILAGIEPGRAACPPPPFVCRRCVALHRT